MTPTDATPATGRRGWAPLLLGIAGVALAALGERAVPLEGRSGDLALPLYLAGIALFAVGAWPARPPGAPGTTPTPAPASRRTGWVVTAAGLLLAVGLNATAIRILTRDFSSVVAIRLWLASLAVLLVTGIAAGQRTGWAPLWEFPAAGTPRRRALFGAGLAAILVIGALARFLWLDRIPLGMNADEGDQGAVAIKIARNNYGASVFEPGWYHISNVYFWALAQCMKVFGLDLVGARTLGAICSFVTLAAVLWLLRRHFGARAALLGGLVFALLGASLQFARFTTCATPLAMLWTISAGLFLEAARRGPMWAWIGAGIAGGMSIYTYPTGRLWPVVAAFYGLYLLGHGLSRKRAAITGGLAAAAIASILTMSPFFLHIYRDPMVFVIRARETSIFVKENPYRLGYYKPEWTTKQLLVAQVKRSFAIFDQISDQNYLFPSDRPITKGFLGVLTLLGLGAVMLRLRDPRLVLLSIWFWLGFVGVIITVETPSLHRMTAAIPVVAMLSALVLDDLARRVAALPEVPRPALSAVATGAALSVAAVLMAIEARFYFVDYAKMDRWIFPTAFGLAIKGEEGNLSMTMGWYWHHINAGWVRLLGANSLRGALISPGARLPLAIPANKGLTFAVFNKQHAYLPYLEEIYPGGELKLVTHPVDGKLLSLYRVPKAAWQAQRGALASVDGGPARPVRTFGELPSPLDRLPARVRWAAAMHVTRFWNYAFRLGPGPARLEIDGRTVGSAPAGGATSEVRLSLPRGEHQVVYEATVTGKGAAPLEWAMLRQDAEPVFAPVLPSLLTRRDAPARGLLGTVLAPGRNPQLRIDGTLASGSFATDLGLADGSLRFTGTLRAPASGNYQMRLMSQARGEIRIDGRTVLLNPGSDDDQPPVEEFALTEGLHPIEVCLDLVPGKPLGVEWHWTPPGQVESIVPPSALAPPPGGGVANAISWADLGPLEANPRDVPFQNEW